MEKNKNNKETKKKIKLPGRILLLLLLLAVLTLAPYVYDAIRNDPNILLKRISATLGEDSTVDITYTIRPGMRRILRRNWLPLFSFSPEESGAYTFTVSDIVSEDDVFLTLQVTDSNLNNYISTDNMNDRSGSFSETTFLSEGSICYVITEAVSERERDVFSGSFSLSVTKAPEDVRPAEITETGPALINVREDSQTAVMFVPAESGYFRFESRVVSGDKTASSSISSVRTTDNKEVKRSEGICRLEGGKEYYVWVSAHDLSGETAKTEVSCSRIKAVRTDQPGEYSIDGDTIIEFTSQETKNLAVYSVSDGDARCLLYDNRGFPLNSDDDSGGDLSGNDKDFALVLQAQKKAVYLIYTDGQFNECTIVITEYKGDGSSIGKADVLSLHPDENLNEEPGEEVNEEPGEELPEE